MFQLPDNQSVELVNTIRPKFLLIKYEFVHLFIYFDNLLWLVIGYNRISIIYSLIWIFRQLNIVQIKWSSKCLNRPRQHREVSMIFQNICSMPINQIYFGTKPNDWYAKNLAKVSRLSSNKKKNKFVCFSVGFFEQLTRQISPRRLSRDDPTLDFLLYIFEAIELIRVTTNWTISPLLLLLLLYILYVFRINSSCACCRHVVFKIVDKRIRWVIECVPNCKCLSLTIRFQIFAHEKQ